MFCATSPMRGAIGPGQGGSSAVSEGVLGGSGVCGVGGVGGSPTSTPEVTSGGSP